MAGGFVDVLDTPAQSSPLAAASLMQAVTRARAIGWSPSDSADKSSCPTDGGATWKQSGCP